MDPHYLEDLPESPTTRILSGTASGLGIGAVVGSIFANWAELPQTLPGRSALGVTGKIMLQHSITFGIVGLAFTGTDCLAESIRGKRDKWNGIYGGAAAGLSLGARLGRPQVGVGAAAALAVTSFCVDLSGGKLIGNGLFNDGATLPVPTHPTPIERGA